MKLWLLRPVEGLEDEDPSKPNLGNPWEPWFDKAFGFVVRAETEAEARSIADYESGEEQYHLGNVVWKDPRYSTCTELLPEGDPGVIIRDFASA